MHRIKAMGFVILHGASFEDAERRLAKQWKEYAKPYLSPSGQLVRWQLDQIVDVYSIGEETIDPRGTEVYSRLSGRRMRPEFVWNPSTRRYA